MVVFPQSKSEFDIIVLFVTIVYACYPFLAVGIVCEMGQRASDLISEISDTLKQFSWYSFPYEVQRTLPCIIIISNVTFAVECFGSIVCNRDAFKKVAKIQLFMCFFKLNFPYLLDNQRWI